MKIIFLTKGALPFPPTKGGAVETLLYQLVIANEQQGLFEFLVLSTTTSVESYQQPPVFKHTKLVTTTKLPTNWQTHWGNRLFSKVASIVTQKKISKDDHPELIDLLKDVLSKESADLVIDLNCVDRVKKIRKFYSGKLVIYLHNDYLNKQTFCAKQLLKQIDGVISVCQFLKEKIQEIEKEFPVYVVKNGIDTNQLSALSTLYKPEIKKKYEIAPAEQVLVFNGRLVKTKGPDKLLKALQDGRFDKLSLKIFIIGGITHGSSQQDTYQKKLLHLAKVLPHEVLFTGHILQQQLFEILAIADYCIAPSSFNETCCLAMVEAQYLEIPVLVTDIGAIKEYFVADGGILLRKEALEESLKNALSEVLFSEEKKKRMKKTLANKQGTISIEKMYEEFAKAVNQLMINES